MVNMDVLKKYLFKNTWIKEFDAFFFFCDLRIGVLVEGFGQLDN